MEYAIVEHRKHIREHRKQINQLKPKLAKAKRDHELRHPSSYIEIDGKRSVLRFVESKRVKAASDHEAGTVHRFQPIDPEATYFLHWSGRLGDPDAHIVLNLDNHGLGFYHVFSSGHIPNDWYGMWTHGAGDYRWEGTFIDMERDGYDAATGRGKSWVREVRIRVCDPTDSEQEHEDADDSDDESTA